MKTSPSAARQWEQLLALTFAHAVADTYVGLIAPVLVPMRDHYGVSFALLIFVVSLLGFSSNIFQIFIGHLQTALTRPDLISAGVLLAGLAVFIPVLPAGPFCVVWMSLLALLAGLGVAAVHPEGLRALHGLDKIPASLTTSVFMVSGFMGFAGGAILSSTLTEHFGLDSLVWLYAIAPVAAGTLFLSGVRLPADTAHGEKPGAAPARPENIPGIPFAPLFLIAAVLATSSQIQATLLPSYLHGEAGYSLSFSGFSFTLFGLGGMAGAIFWSILAPRLGHLSVLFYTALAGAPLTALYLAAAPLAASASGLLTFVGFIVYTGFPLCITLARYSDSSLRFGTRMGLISGGSWGIAALVMWGIGPLTAYTGLGVLLHLIWIGYLAAALVTFRLMRQPDSLSLPHT
ncbi:MAG: MFS transporter [Kiritimatiellae bacterium]|nr:MFS transporter [Kiritimatiellia bacterium]